MSGYGSWPNKIVLYPIVGFTKFIAAFIHARALPDRRNSRRRTGGCPRPALPCGAHASEAVDVATCAPGGRWLQSCKLAAPEGIQLSDRGYDGVFLWSMHADVAYVSVLGGSVPVSRIAAC